MNLAIWLAGNGVENQTIRKSVDKQFQKKSKRGIIRYDDARIMLEYKGKWIYIATAGDTWSICRCNYHFFEGDFDKMEICKIDASGATVLSPAEKENVKGQKPDICICACSPSKDDKGSIKAIHSYCEQHILDYAQQIWIKKDKNRAKQSEESIMKETEKQVKKIISMIDTIYGLA